MSRNGPLALLTFAGDSVLLLQTRVSSDVKVLLLFPSHNSHKPVSTTLQVIDNDSLGDYTLLAVSRLGELWCITGTTFWVPEGIRHPLGVPHTLNHPSSNILPVFADGYLLNLTFHDLSTSHVVNLLNLAGGRVFP
jgi:hypothetical protein